MSGDGVEIDREPNPVVAAAIFEQDLDHGFNQVFPRIFLYDFDHFFMILTMTYSFSPHGFDHEFRIRNPEAVGTSSGSTAKLDRDSLREFLREKNNWSNSWSQSCSNFHGFEHGFF